MSEVFLNEQKDVNLFLKETNLELLLISFDHGTLVLGTIFFSSNLLLKTNTGESHYLFSGDSKSA